MKKKNRRITRVILLAVLLQLFGPAYASASGEWLSFSGETARENAFFQVQEYTGTVRMTFLGLYPGRRRKNPESVPGILSDH